MESGVSRATEIEPFPHDMARVHTYTTWDIAEDIVKQILAMEVSVPRKEILHIHPYKSGCHGSNHRYFEVKA